MNTRQTLIVHLLSWRNKNCQQLSWIKKKKKNTLSLKYYAHPEHWTNYFVCHVRFVNVLSITEAVLKIMIYMIYLCPLRKYVLATQIIIEVYTWKTEDVTALCALGGVGLVMTQNLWSRRQLGEKKGSTFLGCMWFKCNIIYPSSPKKNPKKPNQNRKW